MAKLIDLSLEELYAKPKITSTVAAAIASKEDFTKPCTNWCEKVCTLKCKNIPSAQVLIPSTPVDILFIQSFDSLGDVKFNRPGDRIEKKNRDILFHLFKRAVEQEGVSLLTSFAVTNLTKCQIKGADVNKGKGPTSTVLSKCSPYLLQEIHNRNPDVIISLSTEVTRALGSKKSNTRGAGEIGTVEVKGKIIPFIPTLHPKALTMLRQNSSGAFWGPDFYRVIINDIRKALQLISGKIRVPLLENALKVASSRITICRDMPSVRRWCNLLREKAEQGTVLSFDTETTSLDRYLPTAKVITIQFGWRDDDGVIRAVVIPLWHRCNLWYNANIAWTYVRPLLVDEKILKIGHNAKFDITYIATTTGVRVKGLLLDTMLLMHSLESGVQGMYGLKKAVHDKLPWTELGGYEDKLPKLTKPKKVVDGESEEEGETEELDGEF